MKRLEEEMKVRREVFNAYLKRTQGKILSENDKVLIEAWELHKRLA